MALHEFATFKYQFFDGLNYGHFFECVLEHGTCTKPWKRDLAFCWRESITGTRTCLLPSGYGESWKIIFHYNLSITTKKENKWNEGHPADTEPPNTVYNLWLILKQSVYLFTS